MPQLPKNQTKAVSVHCNRFLLHLFVLWQLEQLRSRPHIGNLVVKEHVAIDHEVIGLEVGEAHLNREMGHPQLLHFHVYVMRC